MPNKISRRIDIHWSNEEQEIFQKAIDLCKNCAQDKDLEDWASENCSESFFDVAGYLQDFLDNSI